MKPFINIKKGGSWAALGVNRNHATTRRHRLPVSGKEWQVIYFLCEIIKIIRLHRALAPVINGNHFLWLGNYFPMENSMGARLTCCELIRKVRLL